MLSLFIEGFVIFAFLFWLLFCNISLFDLGQRNTTARLKQVLAKDEKKRKKNHLGFPKILTKTNRNVRLHFYDCRFKFFSLNYQIIGLQQCNQQYDGTFFYATRSRWRSRLKCIFNLDFQKNVNQNPFNQVRNGSWSISCHLFFLWVFYLN